MSASNINKNIIEEYLKQFYLENDPEALKNGFDISGLAQFTIDNGIDSLNKLLFNKYGKLIDFGTDEATDLIPKSTKRKLDKGMLRAELKVFYTEMKDIEQLSVIEEVVEWTREYGIENLDKQFEELYGISLTNFYVKAAEQGLKVNGKEKTKKEKDDISMVIKVNKRMPLNIIRKQKKLPLPCCLNIILAGKV